MNETLGRPGEDPEYLTETLTGPQFDELAFGLLTHAGDVIYIDGQCLVNINDRAFNRDNDTVTVSCKDEAGRRHVFSYRLDPDSPVSHEVLENEPDTRS